MQRTPTTSVARRSCDWALGDGMALLETDDTGSLPPSLADQIAQLIGSRRPRFNERQDFFLFPFDLLKRFRFFFAYTLVCWESSDSRKTSSSSHPRFPNTLSSPKIKPLAFRCGREPGGILSSICRPIDEGILVPRFLRHSFA